jgi:hypothetical protein
MEPGLVGDRGADPWRGVAVEVIWTAIPLVSRILLVLMVVLIPAGYLAGAYYVAPQSCVRETQQVYAALLMILVCHSAYVWIVDRPKVGHAVRTAIADKRLNIRRLGWLCEIEQGTQNVRFGVVSLAFVSIGTLMLLAWCFWDPIVAKACAGQLHGSPRIELVMLGTTFLLVVMHQVLFWWSVVLSARRESA